MTRIFLFLATNIAVIALISITFQVLGIEGLLLQNGVDLNLYALLVMSAVIGFGGSFISLAISKWPDWQPFVSRPMIGRSPNFAPGDGVTQLRESGWSVSIEQQQ